MIEISNVPLSLNAGLEENLELRKKELGRVLGVSPDLISSLKVIRRGVDARKRSHIHFVATLCAELPNQVEQALLEKSPKGVNVKEHKPYQPLVIPECSTPSSSPVVIGAGPAGLFAALYLARAGLKPVLVEQGGSVEQRQKDVQDFVETGKLNPYSNIQFGEGGAGTFSDGKLTTNTKNAYTQHVLQWFVDAGAPEEILWQGNPHLGSDNLPHIVATMRNEIIERGGQVKFNTRLSNICLEAGKLKSIQLESIADGTYENVPCETMILACGHSARDIFVLCKENGFVMEQKPFSVGVRIEHPQSMINKSLWGGAANHPALKAAAYKLAVHLPGGRSVYTFCMCPGGTVVAATSEEEAIVTNGMSNFARDGRNANAAVLVNVDPKDFPSKDVLSGVDFQRSIEKAAFQVSQRFGGKPYQAPAQTVGNFLAENGKKPAKKGKGKRPVQNPSFLKKDVETTYTRGVVDAPISQVFPRFVTDSLAEALPLLGKKLAGFDDPHALLVAPETRSSSPVRVCRSKNLQAYFEVLTQEQQESLAQDNPCGGTGIYPCGEGPGFAGGIMSAAVDGLRVAVELTRRYMPTKESAMDCSMVEDSAAKDSANNSSLGVCTKSLPENLSVEAFSKTLSALKQGKVVVFPTDTVYGLGVSSAHAGTPETLYRIKQREAGKPVAWLVGSVDDLLKYGKDVPEVALQAAKKYWPGALTLVVKANENVPPEFLPETKTIGLRMPNDPLALKLIEELGCPIATTSANPSGASSPKSFAEVDKELLSCVAAYIYDEEEKSGVSSTVVDCTASDIKVLRQGDIVLE